ncbi:MAG: hypothetical protein NVS9B14_16400 [Candidatus Acidiferrum sp.]
MEKSFVLKRAVIGAIVLLFAGVLAAQRTADRKLIVNGKTASVGVVQMDGHSYVDVEILAQVTNGSVKFEASQIVLTIPSSTAETAVVQDEEKLSKGFASAAIATLAEMREWRGALGALVTYGLAVDGKWAQLYRQRVEASLDQANVAATTDSDRNALRLLSTQFANLAKWESVVTAERANLDGSRTVATNSLQNDPVLQKFSSCGRFLSVMLGSGVFSGNASCE